MTSKKYNVYDGWQDAIGFIKFECDNGEEMLQMEIYNPINSTRNASNIKYFVKSEAIKLRDALNEMYPNEKL